MIADAQAIVRREGDLIWAGLSQAPLPVVLIDQHQETLFCGVAIEGFSAIGFDPVTRCSMQARARELPVDLAAATELGNTSVIQMGLPAALEGTRADWVLTFLHEAFHQHQSSLPGYVTAVDAVRERLSHAGAQWALDYPFPYSDPAIKAAVAQMTSSAMQFLNATSKKQEVAAISDYVRARNLARDAAGADAWLYYEFQVGQEGVARWVELRFAAAVSETRPDITAIGKDRSAGLATSLRAIDSQGIEMWKRSVFYVLGPIEAMMLEKVRPDWRLRYAADPFSLGSMLNAPVPSTARAP